MDKAWPERDSLRRTEAEPQANTLLMNTHTHQNLAQTIQMHGCKYLARHAGPARTATVPISILPMQENKQARQYI